MVFIIYSDYVYRVYRRTVQWKIYLKSKTVKSLVPMISSFRCPIALSRTLQNNVEMAGFGSQYHRTHQAQTYQLILFCGEQNHCSKLSCFHGDKIQSPSFRTRLLWKFKYVCRSRQVSGALLCGSNGTQVFRVYCERT